MIDSQYESYVYFSRYRFSLWWIRKITRDCSASYFSISTILTLPKTSTFIYILKLALLIHWCVSLMIKHTIYINIIRLYTFNEYLKINMQKSIELLEYCTVFVVLNLENVSRNRFYIVLLTFSLSCEFRNGINLILFS